MISLIIIGRRFTSVLNKNKEIFPNLPALTTQLTVEVRRNLELLCLSDSDGVDLLQGPGQEDEEGGEDEARYHHDQHRLVCYRQTAACNWTLCPITILSMGLPMATMR